LVAEYRTGATAADLGRRYGLAKTTVLRLIRQAGERVRHPRFSIAETARLVELYESGLAQKEIAERLDRSPSAVWHCLRRLGLLGSVEDAGCETNAGGADPDPGTGHQVPGLGSRATAERASGVAAGLAASAAPVARFQREVAVEFTLDGGDVDMQVVEDPPGT